MSVTEQEIDDETFQSQQKKLEPNRKSHLTNLAANQAQWRKK